jgi:hypothetical protein
MSIIWDKVTKNHIINGVSFGKETLSESSIQTFAQVGIDEKIRIDSLMENQDREVIFHIEGKTKYSILTMPKGSELFHSSWWNYDFNINNNINNNVKHLTL